MGGKVNMKRQSDKKVTKQIRIDSGMHKIVKVEASRRGQTIKELVEEYIIYGLERENVKFE